jgi:class 3 adenylate cyclase/tetratricopeptide (TPR) repeat protein
MTCRRCSTVAPPDAAFCPGCGGRLAIACARCGTEPAPDHRFCRRCGEALAASLAGIFPPGRFRSPEAYTPRHLAERILTSKAAVEGERKQVTVLFADLKGSMELVADRDPEEARRLLDPVLDLMMEAVHRYEGTVNQVMGDGIMALFGAPLAHEDHAVRACYAALRMQDRVRRHADAIRREQGVSIEIRVGVNSGDVVVRSIGSDLRMDYSAVGQTTHLAARMEQLAPAGASLVTAATGGLVEGFVALRAIGPVSVKGLAEPVEVYELLGAGPARTRLQAAVTRGLSHFVGRDEELGQLRRALDRAAAGHGQVVAVVGEPGVGKSRLFREVIHSHRTHGWLVLEAGSASHGKAISYLPAVDLLRAYFGIGGQDGHRAIREKVTGRLLTLDRALESALPPLLALLDVPGGDAAWDALEPRERRRRTLDAVKRLLLRESQLRPLVLVVEDLHWLDAETQTVLDDLVESLPAARILLLVNYRPEYAHGWGSKTYYAQLRLDVLPPESADDLLRGLLGPDPSLDLLKQLLAARTEGNPLFLEESVRALVETGALAGEPGARRLALPVESLEVPATVQAILAARIDRLPAAEKRLLQAASVVGKDVPLELLQAVADVGSQDLPLLLDHLRAAEFLYEARLFPDPEYTFKHALTHEVAYGSLLHDRRSDLHARIGRAIENLSPERRADQLERLAHHSVHGELWDQAVTYLREAAHKALARSAHREATAHLEQALEALRHLPDTAETRALAVDLRLDLAPALAAGARYGDILQHMIDAEPLAEASGDRIRLGLVLLRKSQAIRMFGDHSQALDTGRRAVAVAEEAGDPLLRSETLHRLGQNHLGIGESGAAIDLLRRSVAALGDLAGSAERSGYVRGVGPHAWLGYALGYRGEFGEAISWGRHALRLAESGNSPGNLLAAVGTLGLTLVERGDHRGAIEFLARGLHVCETWKILDWSITIESALGLAWALAGRFEEAIGLQRRAEAEEPHAPQGFPAARILRFGETLWLAGRIDDARAQAEEGLRLARASGERGGEVRALRLLGEILTHEGHGDAERCFQDALSLADALGMRPQAARCHLGLGLFLGGAGKSQRAEQHAATALAMFRDMEMSRWVEECERRGRP